MCSWNKNDNLGTHLTFSPEFFDMDSSISEFGQIHCCKQGFRSKINNKMAKSVDPDETPRKEPSHLDLHCLQRYPCWSTGMEGLTFPGNKQMSFCLTTHQPTLITLCHCPKKWEDRKIKQLDIWAAMWKKNLMICAQQTDQPAHLQSDQFSLCTWWDGYPYINVILISPWKHILLVLSEVLLMSKTIYVFVEK